VVVNGLGLFKGENMGALTEPPPNIDPMRRASLERAVELRGQLMRCT
jgi:hypothetical protein